MPSNSRSNAGSSGVRQRRTLQIVPNTRFIVFHGNEHEASSVKLSGVVRLTTPEPMSILKPKVRLEGKRKINWNNLSNLSASEVTDKNTFWTEEQKLGGVESAHKVKAGVIEWPFEFELSPSMPESVEGLANTYIAYHLHASVSRPGWNAKDLVAQEHIRIVRTIGQESTETTRERVNADIWANKIAYTISIPSDLFVFGTSISADVELSPLRKGLEMGQIDLRLMENVVKRIQASEVPGSKDRTKSQEIEVAREVMDFPEESMVTYDNETPDNPSMSDEMYRFKVTLPLPKSLNECRQDVDSHQIHITHRFKIMISLHNPEGHVSQLVCRLPVKLFISPNLPVDESNEVCPRIDGLTDEALNTNETTTPAPPQYGQHILDQLFSDMNPAGYATRTASVTSSSSSGSARSRSSSNEAMEFTEGEPSSVPGDLSGPSPAMLQSRLADLQAASLNGAMRSYSEASACSNPADPTSEPVSRRVSNEEQTSAIRRGDYDMSNLSRVPSYGYALRSTGTITPIPQVPPTYVEATSRPSTPPLRPSQVHFQDSSFNQRSLASGSAHSDMAAFGPALPHTSQFHGGRLSLESQLRAIRAET